MRISEKKLYTSVMHTRCTSTGEIRHTTVGGNS